jgi:hypothetical protein
VCERSLASFRRPHDRPAACPARVARIDVNLDMTEERWKELHDSSSFS